MNDHSNTGVVVIGRNEAPRLRSCFESLPSDTPICYVDSGSDDGSPAIARSYSIPTLQLSGSQPFGAARARNAGFNALLEEYPKLERVLFLDGDCVLDPDFLGVAITLMNKHDDCAIIVGRLEEANSGNNIYGILADLEWSSPASGEILDFGQLGGIMLVCVPDFLAVGGFNPDFIAGEDSELGIRLHLTGRKTIRIINRMAIHAMEMQRFGQWWRRSIRAGHALAHRYAVHGKSSLADSRSAVHSTFVYGILIPIVVLMAVSIFGFWGMVPVIIYVYLGLRFFSYYRRKGATRRNSLIGTAFGIIAKLANGIGMVRFHVQRARGNFKIIEYK